MKILGLDVGEKRIGVAKVDSNTRIAVPVGYLLNDTSLWPEIGRLARLNSTNWFVLGLPRSNEGNETKQSLYVRQFAKTLTEKVPGAKIRFQDESLTSVEAEERLKSRKKKYEKGDIDAEAATIILQDFIEHFREYEKDMIPETASPAAAAMKKNSDKVALNARKVHENAKKVKQNAGKVAKNVQKTPEKVQESVKKLKKWPILVAIIVLLIGAAGAGAAFSIREEIRRQRQEEYARQEAEMVAEVFTMTIRPGETIFDVKNTLTEAGYTTEEAEAALNATYDFDFLAERPAGASLEGYLFGETYEFYADATAEEVIERFLQGMDEVITANFLRARYAAQGLSLYEGITLASVVQKEAAGPEMATVAQVFLTRLDYGIPLGSDVTVSYALDLIDPERKIYSDNQAALKIDSCYNTRKNYGLPCGPIANPGLDALLAVAEPTDTEYLYFLTGDDGVMYYSYDPDEHERNAYLHCQELCQVSL